MGNCLSSDATVRSSDATVPVAVISADMSPADFKNEIAQIKKDKPNNLMAKHFSNEYFDSLDEGKQRDLMKVCITGVANPDSGLGAYAMNPTDYETFYPYLGKVIRDYHSIEDEKQTHVSNWEIKDPESYDVKKLGLPELSMRVRVGRNLSAFPLPGKMTKDQRLELENHMLEAFEILIKDPAYGGQYNSITPGHKCFVDDAAYNKLVKDHIMFKSMADDKYLNAAGISSDWPHGRGCYVSKDRGFIVWVGEEDHLRIMCMKMGTVITDVFTRLRTALDKIESIPSLKFARSEKYGAVTSCPTNLGTGMRASVLLKLPKLTKAGQTLKDAKDAARPLGLGVRGLGGEHTAAGKDGACDISPQARLMIEERVICQKLWDGIQKMKALEDAAPELAEEKSDAPMEEAEFLKRIAEIKQSHPRNLMAKHFTNDYFNGLNAEQKVDLMKVCITGVANPDSGMGAYAMNPSDYETFYPYLGKVIREYHNIEDEKQEHVSNWDIKDPASYDVKKLGLPDLSMRVRVGRNLLAFPLPGKMTRGQRCELENHMLKAFQILINDPAYGGRYNSITPQHECFVDDATYNKLVKDHIMFKSMADDKYLNAAGISSDWPYGRGCYVSEDRGFIVWVGEEDHLRIMCMKMGTVITDVFTRLRTALDKIESIPSLKFARSDHYGAVTSCPTNLGTGMRASVLLKLPKLTQGGKTLKDAKDAARPLGLGVRGLGGEHTAAGKDGACDISPQARLMIEERVICQKLWDGIQKMKALEDAAPALEEEDSKNPVQL